MAAISYGVGQYVASEGHVGMQSKSLLAGVRRGVVACHGGVATGLTAISEASHKPIYHGLADLGLPLISCDLGSTTGQPQWGNDTSGTRVGQAWTYVKSAFGAKTDKMLLLALSAGAPVALNYARANASNVAAIALLIPGCNVQDCYDNRGLSAGIETAYASAWAANAATHDPAASGNQAALSTIPIKAWHSSDDTAAVASVVESYKTLVNNAGGSMTTQSMGAVGHSTAALDPAEVFAFFHPYIA